MPRMRSPQELLRGTRRELLSRSPRSISQLEHSEPTALMKRGRTCGLFFRPSRSGHSPQQPSALRLLHGVAWQESRHMRSLFDECTQQALFLAMFARNACFSRSKWQDPRLMSPFPGAIGWFWIHGVKILPKRSPFHVERPEIMHSAKMLPGLLGLQCRHKKRIPKRGS